MPKSLRQTTGWLLIVTSLLMLVSFTYLQITFEYPDILRKETDYILQHYMAGGVNLLAAWYGLMFSAVLLAPLAVLLGRVLQKDGGWIMRLAVTFGVMAAMVQFLGLIRWVFLVPYLTGVYTDPQASESARAAAEVVFQSANWYFGAAVGEHLGYLFTSAWTVLVALVLLKVFPQKAWLGWMGIIFGVGIVVGILEPLGVAGVGAVNAISYTLWVLWLMALGVVILSGQLAQEDSKSTL
jgi:hypothetical protein